MGGAGRQEGAGRVEGRRGWKKRESERGWKQNGRDREVERGQNSKEQVSLIHFPSISSHYHTTHAPLVLLKLLHPLGHMHTRNATDPLLLKPFLQPLRTRHKVHISHP